MTDIILEQAEAARNSAKETAKSLDWIAGVSPTKVGEGLRKLNDEQRGDHSHHRPRR